MRLLALCYALVSALAITLALVCPVRAQVPTNLVHVTNCWSTPPGVAHVALLSGAAERYEMDVDLTATPVGWHLNKDFTWSSKTARTDVTITSLRLQCRIAITGDPLMNRIAPGDTIGLTKSIQVPASGPLPRISYQIDEPSPGLRRISIWRAP